MLGEESRINSRDFLQRFSLNNSFNAKDCFGVRLLKQPMLEDTCREKGVSEEGGKFNQADLNELSVELSVEFRIGS